MKSTKIYLCFLLLVVTLFSFRLIASEPLQLENGWAFNYVAIGDSITLTEVITSGQEKLIIPSTVEIDGETYTIVALKKDLFNGNEELKKITISSSLTSLGAEINTQSPETKPYAGNPITLETPIESNDIWQIKAVVNTGGEAFNQWGTALFASGEVPNADHYPGGFQFWLNNGTSNNNGRILIKYGNSNVTYLFNENIKVLPGGTNDVSLSLSYDGLGNYIAILGSEGNTEKKTVTLPVEFAGFDQLSSAITENGSFSQLEISTFAFPKTAESLSGALNLTYISVNPGNPVYASDNGSLYDAAKENLLVDLSEYNSDIPEPVQIGEGWLFNYRILGTDLILTEVVTSGEEALVIPSSVEIEGNTYTITSLKSDLFAGNEVLKRLSVPETLISLDATISTEIPAVKPTTEAPVILTSPVIPEDIWEIKAIVNTGGAFFNQWGTALLATGEVPNLDDYTGGFQFWLNNGTAAGANSSGTLVYKYGAGATKHTFSEGIKVQSGSTENIAITLAYKNGKYVVLVSSGENSESFSINDTPCTGFTLLSTALPSEGIFSQLEITKFDYAETAGSLTQVPNLSFIYVNQNNPVYSSVNGSLLDKTQGTVLVDLSEYNSNTEPVLQLDNGWSFNYLAVGLNLTLTKVVTSGNELLSIPATVNIGEITYTISALKEGLFKDNTVLTELSVSAALTSLGTTVSTETLETKPAIDAPVTLTNAINADNTWVIKARINTGGSYFNEWGTALLASGVAPSLDDYTGGFQFWLNNGTIAGDNSNGTLVYKYGAGVNKHIFSEEIKVPAGSIADMEITLAYNNGEYTAVASSGGKTERYIANIAPCTGFAQLSTALPAAGTFLQLDITKVVYAETAGSLTGVPNLVYIYVDPENPVYSSASGSLYDKSGGNLLVDLSEYGIMKDAPIVLNDGWSFNYIAIGKNLTLTDRVTEGGENLIIPAEVQIEDETYFITSLKNDLFDNNTKITQIEIPATLTSLEAVIINEKPENKPLADNPITLNNEVLASDTWIVSAIVNTAGEYYNQWGTALLATGEVPNLDDYTGGFQFWLNNGTAAGDNSKGTLVYKYGAGATKYVFSEEVKVLAGSRKDLGFTLSYSDSEYTAITRGNGKVEKYSVNVTTPCSGFSQLSSALAGNGTYTQLTISRLNFSDGAGSLSKMPNLASIIVDADNPVYSSKNGSLYDKTGERLLVDLGGLYIDPINESLNVYGYDGRIVIEGLKTGDICKAYTISGVEVNYKAEGLPKGIYIITVNGKSYKVSL